VLLTVGHVHVSCSAFMLISHQEVVFYISKLKKAVGVLNYSSIVVSSGSDHQ